MPFAVHTATAVYAVAGSRDDARADARANGLDTLSTDYRITEVSADFARDWSQRGDWNQYRLVDGRLVEDAKAVAAGLAAWAGEDVAPRHEIRDHGQAFFSGTPEQVAAEIARLRTLSSAELGYAAGDTVEVVYHVFDQDDRLVEIVEFGAR